MDLPFADKLLESWIRRSVRRDPVRPIDRLELANVRSVLLVLTTGLGDAVLSTPVFSALRRALPDRRLVLFVRSSWAPLFAGEEDINVVIPYYGKWRRFLPTLRALRGHAPDLALVLHGNDPDVLPLAYLAGARQILRIPTTGTRYSWLLSNAGCASDTATVAGWHYIDNRLRVLDRLGIAPVRRSPVIKLASEPMAVISEWRRRSFGDRPYLVIHPWAADPYKKWPERQVRYFLELVANRWPQLGLVISGASRDRTSANRLADGLSSAIVTAGVFSIEEAAALLLGAAIVVAPDTGLLHLAAALDVPCVGLFSPTKSTLVGPRTASAPSAALQKPITCNPCLEKRCPYSEPKCMTQFTAEEVLQAVSGVLKS